MSTTTSKHAWTPNLNRKRALADDPMSDLTRRIASRTGAVRDATEWVLEELIDTMANDPDAAAAFDKLLAAARNG